jgi:transcriptional regulator with XRE-family HTH domain
MPKSPPAPDHQAPAFASSIDYDELGHRLRAHRIGAGLQAEDIAARLGVSRAVVYRMEQGKIYKIETIEKLAQLLDTSMASLLGVEVEYYSTALGFFERLRQIEADAERIIAHFEPASQLLLSDAYLRHLETMLMESSAPAAGKKAGAHAGEHAAEVQRILKLLQERKALFEQRRPHLVNLIGLRELERFVHTGLVGRLNLTGGAREQRIQAARREVLHLAERMENEPMHVQIALVDEAMPATSFQLLSGPRRTALAVSPFRLGELPNIHNGIATITTSPEPVKRYEEMIERLWSSAHKGRAGAMMLRKLLDRTRPDGQQNFGDPL